jgi:hypothetical protein
MARTTHRRNQPNARRTLRREVPSTVALLADEDDFAAMQRYATFTFDDHRAYLREMDGLLRSLDGQGVHSSVALFDPVAYAEFCADSLLDPDAAASRARYIADVASCGATVPYEGQPIEHLVPLLVEEADRQATLEYATGLLARLGDCPASCGQDLGRSAYARASQALMRLLEVVGPGVHHAVCSVSSDGPPLLAVLHAESRAEDAVHLAEAEALVFCTVLAVGIATASPGGIVLRTSGTGVSSGTDEVRGWALRDGWPHPLTAAEVFTAYCTDPDTGEPVPPEPGVEYRAGIGLGAPAEGG